MAERCDHEMEVERNGGHTIVYTTYPPQYKYVCKKCGVHVIASSEKDALKKAELMEDAMADKLDDVSKLTDGEKYRLCMEKSKDLLLYISELEDEREKLKAEIACLEKKLADISSR